MTLKKNEGEPFHSNELFDALSDMAEFPTQETSFFQLMIDNVPDLIWAKNIADEYVFANKTICDKLLMCGDTHEALGKNDVYFATREREAGHNHTFGEICVNSDQIVKETKRAGRFIEEGFVRGKYLVLDVNKAPFFNQKGQMIGTVGCGRDITYLKLKEKEKADAIKFVSEQEKYALLGQVAGKMAHDFNNILGAIMGNAEISLMDCQEPDTIKSLNIILEQTIRGKSLTQNLVAFAKDLEPKEEYFNINSKIDLVLEILKNDLADITLIREFKSNIPDLLADPEMIEHALVNLIKNSIHAMSLINDPRLVIKTYVNNKNMIVEIIDNGCGIPEENYKDIYSPSFTLKGSKDFVGAYKSGIKGTGYGMSNVKKYIEKHKGSITFESQVKSGTQFTISIPMIEKELTPDEKDLVAQHLIVTEKKILLVEDEPAIAHVQSKILNSDPFCHEPMLAENGQDAMDLFENNKFDLISLDYSLPGDMNGLDIYKEIRKRDLDIPIVFISGNIGILESMKALISTDQRLDYISKPCENIVYVNTINKWLSV